MPRAYIPLDVRRAVIERAKERCEYCQSRADFTTETFAIDHVLPVSRSGTSDIENLALACSGCNSRKYNKIGNYSGASHWPGKCGCYQIHLASATHLIEIDCLNSY